MNKKQLHSDYIAAGDVTERQFAIDHFGSLDAWYTWADSNPDEVARWRKELELKLKGEMYSILIETARGTSREAVGAAKFLLGKGILTREKDASDTPSEEEIKDVATTQVTRNKVDNDYLRLIVNKA
jgi:hypothetical protein